MKESDKGGGMKAGRNLDQLVGERVMGIAGPKTKISFEGEKDTFYPRYSSDSDAAQKVWDKMAELCPSDTYDKFLEYMPSFIATEVKPGVPMQFPHELVPPEEICLAALKAMGVEV